MSRLWEHCVVLNRAVRFGAEIKRALCAGKCDLSLGQLVHVFLGAAVWDSAGRAGMLAAMGAQLYFDGSDVSLTDNGNEDVDAVAVRSTGVILLSTLSAVSVPGVSGADEDVLQFTPTQLGPATSGSYSMYLDLSAIGIATSENVGAVEYKE